ncbi:MAG: hypothetical protein WBE47_00870 [Candidatus Acidiferrales bacterium]
MQQFATDLRATLSRKTVLNILSAIFSILKFAERSNIPVAKVTFADLQLGAAYHEVERPFFTREQASQIIAAAKEPYKTLFTVAWLTGMQWKTLRTLCCQIQLEQKFRLEHYPRRKSF